MNNKVVICCQNDVAGRSARRKDCECGTMQVQHTIRHRAQENRNEVEQKTETVP